MAVSEAFRVAKGGFTTLAGQVDHVARAAINEIRRELSGVTDDVDELALQLTPASLTLNDDQAAYMEFTADATRGVATIGGNVAAGGSAVVAFRVGASAYASLLASVGATVTVGTGTLAGTTGTDTHLTVRADTATNRLYVENRTGAAHSYGFAFLGLLAGTPAAAWVTV